MNKLLVILLRGTNADQFLVRLGVSILLSKYGIVGTAADFIGFFFRRVVGVFITEGIYQIDLTRDSWIEGTNRDEFKKLAVPAYRKAKAKLYSPEEKAKIRKEFLDISRKFIRVGRVRP